ncbi:MAG: PepSY-associated TM helix domain-containing protein [Sphingobacterium sp.]
MTHKRAKQKSLKNILGKLHLFLGLLFGVIFFTVCVTGMLLSFEKELTPLLWPKEQQVTVQTNRLSLAHISQKAEAIYPHKKLFRIEIPSDPSRSVRIQYGQKKTGYWYAYMNPYTGALLSKGRQSDRFFQKTLDIHRFLLVEKIGSTLTGISALAALILALSGVYLWWPKNKYMLKQRVTMKMAASFKRKIWDFHAVGGFYASLFLIVFTLTGLTWSFDWYNKQFYKVLGSTQKSTKEKISNTNKLAFSDYLVLDTIYQQLNNLYPTSGNIIVTFPEKKDLAFALTKENFSNSILQINQAFFDSKSGQLLKNNPLEKLPLAQQVQRMMKPIHMGSIFGLPSKIIAFLAVTLAASLPITGIWIWLNKRKKKTPSKSQKKKAIQLQTTA